MGSDLLMPVSLHGGLLHKGSAASIYQRQAASCALLCPALAIQPMCPVVVQDFSDVYPHLITATQVPKLVKIADLNWDDVDAVFCCLPHATTQEVISSVPKSLKIVDLSADFRLANVDTYAEWCGHCLHILPHDVHSRAVLRHPLVRPAVQPAKQC